MTKRYLKEIEHVDKIIVFDALGDYLEEEQEGENWGAEYFKDEEEFERWNTLANAIKYFDDNELEDDDYELVELEDYITIAEEHGFKGDKNGKTNI